MFHVKHPRLFFCRLFHVKHFLFLFSAFPLFSLQRPSTLAIINEHKHFYLIGYFQKVGAHVAKTIAIVNQKGGVGKTTTCVNLAAALTEAGQRILLCDFDPQANSTSGMGVDKTVSKGIYDALIGEVPVEDALVHTKYGDVLPSNKALAGAGIELIGMERREFLLRDALDKVKDRYDFLFIDCPPSLELLTLNALCAADAILVPALTEAGQRILLCDFDPQANSTSGMGVDKTVSKGIYDALIGEVPVEDALVHTKYGDVLPSNKALAGAGIELIGMERREFLLRDALDKVKDRYDFLFIDCPPSLELLTLNALCAADAILVPVQGEYYALEGLSDLMNTVRIVRRSLNPRLELDGVLLTMFDGRTNLALQVAEEVKHYFPGKVYATVIPRNVRLSEAPSHGKPITAYDRTSRGAEAYTAFAAEFLKKQSA